MNKSTRLKFFAGIIGVLVVCVTLFIYLDYSMSRVHSVDAQLESDNYTVGIDYSGVITNQFISEGSHIEVGDPLFELRSSTLAEAIRDNQITESALLYSAKQDGTVRISAAAPGQVQSIAYRKGAFVPANSQIAVINNEGGLYASATFVLSSPDYARLNTNSLVTLSLPDGKHVQGTVYNIELERLDKEVQTTVRVRFDNSSINTGSFSVGTPLNAVLELRNDTLFDRIVTAITSAFTPKSGN